MDYQLYYEVATEAGRLVEAGQYAAALEKFAALLRSDIADLDKAAMCWNVALVHQKMGEGEESLKWLDQGIAFERPLYRFFVTEHKAAWLTQNGRAAEGLALYQEMLTNPALTEADRHRIQYNVGVLESGRT